MNSGRFIQPYPGNRHITLEKINSTYKDFALRERKWLESQDYIEKLTFWKKELAGSNDLLSLPFDFIRPKVQRFQGAEIQLVIDRILKEKLIGVGKKQGASLPVVLFSAFGILMARYTLQEDLVIGVPFANRNQEELQQLVGVLINSLPIRLVLDDKDHLFTDPCARPGQNSCLLLKTWRFPLKNWLKRLKVKRTNNLNPIFQVML